MTTEVRIAVVVRARLICAAVVTDRDVLEVVRHRLRDRGHGASTRVLVELARDYAAKHLVLETDSPFVRTWHDGQVRVITTTIDAAKGRLGSSTHRTLYRNILNTFPKLARFLRVLRPTGEIATSDRRRTTVLLAVALGLHSFSITQSNQYEKVIKSRI